MMTNVPHDVSSVFLSLSKGICRTCRELVQARYIASQDRVYLERLCPKHGASRALVAEDLGWYLGVMKQLPITNPPMRTIPERNTCPTGCGPCGFHAQACRLPVFSVTNACDLRCPICFTYNRADKLYFMTPDEFDRQIDCVVSFTSGVDLINITGGEPTMHPQLFELLKRAKHEKIGRITLNTNGLNLARDPDLAKRLADLGIYVVLSLDTFDPHTSLRLHARDITKEKKKALETLSRFEVQTTILTVLIKDINEGELPSIIDLVLENDFVRSLTIQTMTYTGQGGGGFFPRNHLSVDGVERRIQQASRERIKMNHFMPLPTAHPLCYGVCYLLQDNQGTVHPFTDLVDKEILYRHLGDGYLLRPSYELESEIKKSIDRIWSQAGSSSLLSAIKEMLNRVYPRGETLSVSQRQQRAEKMLKTIYVHAHMDEDTYEIGRAMRCPDQVPVESKKLIGACNYNLFHRMHDQRFWVKS